MEPIQWHKLTPEQRNDVVHEKMFGHQRKTTYAIHGISSDKFMAHTVTSWQTGGPDTPRYSQSMDAAWLVVEYITRPPETRDEAKNASATRFMLWFECAKLWACSRDEAINEICIAALRMLGYEVLTEDVSQ